MAPHREDAPRPRLANARALLRDILATAGFVIAVFTLLQLAIPRSLVLGTSMQPNFYEGQRLVISRVNYLFGEPQRGDIIVFNTPEEGRRSTAVIKRVIGMPGDRVQMRDGTLYLNDTAVPQEPAGDFAEVYERQGSAGQFPRCANAPVGQGGTCLKSRYMETLPGGRSYPVLNIEDGGFGDNTPAFTVPEGHFFFIGDNRDNSVDSRVPQNAGGVGMVPFDHLIGRANRVMFSSAGSSMLHFWTWRSDRFFHRLQ